MGVRRKPIRITRNTLDGLRFSTQEVSERSERLINTARQEGFEGIDIRDVARIRFDLEMALRTIQVIEDRVKPKVAETA